jgi:regulator of cell morphogenesis and NO signaling
MPPVSPDTPVADLVTAEPARSRVFEALGIDYCCGGDHSLAAACRKHDLDPHTVIEMLDAEVAPSHDATDWSEAPLDALIDHIVDTHHASLREELPRLDALLSRVVGAHGDAVDWLPPTQEVFTALRDALYAHMESEEDRVFPAIRRLAADSSAALDDDIEQMMEEHDEAGAALEQLRALTRDYTPPSGACPKFRAALEGLEALETDMHRHVHKENHILFPRARAQRAA